MIRLIRRRLPRIGQSVPAVCPPSVAAEQDHPRLKIWHLAPDYWGWRLTAPGGELLDSAVHDTWREALAVGLAALETASLTEPR